MQAILYQEIIPRKWITTEPALVYPFHPDTKQPYNKGILPWKTIA
jgi:hypothetical protein